MRFVMGGGKLKFLFVPRGVAPGGMVLGGELMDMIYPVNQHFSTEDPDEWRLPWASWGMSFGKSVRVDLKRRLNLRIMNAHVSTMKANPR